VLLDECTQLTGYHRQSAVRLLSDKPIRELLIYPDGQAIKLKLEKTSGEPQEEAGVLRWGHSRPAPCLDVLLVPVREDTRLAYAATDGLYRPVAGLSPHRGKPRKSWISPAVIDRHALRLKGKRLTKPLLALKSSIPTRTFYSGEEWKTPGFRHLDTVGLESATTADRPLRAGTSPP
jgi:hypothetical protein